LRANSDSNTHRGWKSISDGHGYGDRDSPRYRYADR
jgi:hypothetical protein